MPFLTASWLDLALLNYDAPPSLLAPLVPRGTELDTWHGRALISVVGFYFADTRVLGLSIPRHRSFEEVNLRFYVRRDPGSGPVRRGVVFVRELVPRLAIAVVARAFYNEPYLSVPMRHSTTLGAAAGGRVEYGWEFRGRSYRLAAEAEGAAAVPLPGSEAEFITEHYWGYTRQRDGSTLEYRGPASALARVDVTPARVFRPCRRAVRPGVRRDSLAAASVGVRRRRLTRVGLFGTARRVSRPAPDSRS